MRIFEVCERCGRNPADVWELCETCICEDDVMEYRILQEEKLAALLTSAVCDDRERAAIWDAISNVVMAKKREWNEYDE